MDDEVIETPDEILEAENTEFTIFGMNRDDIGTIILRTAISAVCMTVFQILQKKAKIAFDNYSTDVETEEPIEVPSEEA